MNIELRFLQKAIEDKNYVNFTYKEKIYKKIKPLKLLEKNNTYFIETNEMRFEFNLIKKLLVLRNKFD